MSCRVCLTWTRMIFAVLDVYCHCFRIIMLAWLDFAHKSSFYFIKYPTSAEKTVIHPVVRNQQLHPKGPEPEFDLCHWRIFRADAACRRGNAAVCAESAVAVTFSTGWPCCATTNVAFYQPIFSRTDTGRLE